jgi:acetyl-CoA carboxylase, biotin carboxylase subunit
MFRKVLIANRGEIAVRVARTLREMDIRSVAVFSEVDRTALHVRMCDEAYLIGKAPAAESYLDPNRIIDAAKRAGADAIHPGYGFLSENPRLPEACAAAGITFVGPEASAMRSMGSKTGARALMAAAGVPIVPGASPKTVEEAKTAAKEIGYPIMIKASAGGGGKGMRLVHDEAELVTGWDRASSEAQKAFGDATVYLEKAIINPRHVEIQVLGDRHGNVVHLFERDCSIQRRHQKVVEETPCPVATPELVAKMGEVAVKGAKAVGYFSAGTFEFLLAQDGSFYFLEMNTRLQVEHPITEWITGTDLVREMLNIADGGKLPFDQSGVERRGASIECRVYAEDPSTNFLPSPGTIHELRVPGGPFVRDDGGVYPGAEVSSFYDPIVSKLSVWGPTRAIAVQRMQRALSEYVVTGIRTNLAFHQKLLAHPEFVKGTYDTGFIDRYKDELLGYATVPDQHHEKLAVAAAIAAAQGELRAGKNKAQNAQGGGSTLSPWAASARLRGRA